MKKNNILTNFIILIFLFVITSCKEIGLGPALDQNPPTIEIITPKDMAFVQKDLLIEGIASDDTKISKIEVSIKTKDMSELQFKWKDNKWLSFNGKDWQEYPDATFSGTEKCYEWKIYAKLPDNISQQDVFVTASTVDGYGNSSAKSKVERSVTVDNVKPIASVSEPSMNLNYVEVLEKYENAKLEDNLIISSLINGDFEIRINQTENARTGKFIIFIDEESDTTIPSYEDEPDLLNLPHVYSKTEEGTRNFSVTVKNEDLAPSVQKGKHLLRLVTESYDEAGNCSRVVQGFFIYWNEADKPWTSMTSGDSGYVDGDEQSSVYPSSDILGYAYDDDGLASVEIIFEVFDNNNWYKDNNRSQIIEFTNSNEEKTWTTWSVKALGESKHFRITSKATDKNGLAGEPLTRYFRVSDVNPPQLSNIKVLVKNPTSEECIEISPSDEKNCLLGNSDGKFTITGDVQDDTEIKSIKMVRIAAKNKSNYLSYLTKQEMWNSSQDGNLLFDLTKNLKGAREDKLWKGSFSKEISIFDDIGNGGFGIGNPNNTDSIKDYMFIFRVEDSSGTITTETFTFKGDIDAPILKIEKVIVVSKDDSKKEYDFSNSATSLIKLDAYNRDSEYKITDKLYFIGSWSDNSFNQWKDLSKIGKIILSNGETVTMKEDGTWQSSLFTPIDSTTYTLTASLSDFGGNTTKVSESFFISSNIPELLRITSENSTGNYKNGDKIIIVLEYNKRMTFKGGTTPKLVLNNEGIATYLSGKGESKHKYEYKVGSTPGEKNISEKLNVNSIITNENIWYDSDEKKIENPSKLPDSNNLSDNREIYIDNDSPRIKNITVITGSGSYNAGRDLNFQMEFTKDVEIANLSDLKLKVNISNNGKTETEIPATTKIDSKTVLFKYIIIDGDNTPEKVPLKFIEFIGGSNNIKDSAGNIMENFTPEHNGIDNANIFVDTIKPAKPNITGISNGGLYYDDISSIKVTGFEEETSTGYYSFDGGNSWIEYNDSVSSITQNGNYRVCAKQIDNAGNESEISEVIQVTLDKGNLLNLISSTNSPKIYKSGDKIDINLRFRKPVKFSQDVKLKLGELDENGKEKNSLEKRATLVTTDLNNEIHFEYTVQEIDYCSPLEVLAIECNYDSIKDEKGQNVKDYIKLDGIKLSKMRNIELLNGKPIVENVKLEETTGKERELKITFNSKITKQPNGYITLKQKDDEIEKFEAPAILTKSQYNEYGEIIRNYYKETTNGWDSSTGKPDLSTKYVLKYEYDTDDSDLLKALKNIYKEADHNISPDTVPISMASNYVTVSEDGKTLVISLKDDYILPVQGANYEVTIPANIVINNIGNSNEEIYKNDNTKYILSNLGVETPIIRVNRINETIENGKISQNDTTTYKVDCQTPGVTINLKTKEETPDYLKLIDDDGYSCEQKEDNDGKNDKEKNKVIMARKGTEKITTPPVFGISVKDLTNSGEINKKEEKEIGTKEKWNNSLEANKGYKILIEATAEKNGKSSAPTYESAMRTIIILEETGGNKCNIWDSNIIDRNCRWVRGGDDVSGGVSTADFPFSWNTKEYDKIRGMTPLNEYDKYNNNTWYFISWNINITAYLHFFAGDIPEDAAENGPKHWLSSSCGWTGLKEDTSAYPGECSIFATDANELYWGYTYIYGNDDGSKHYDSR